MSTVTYTPILAPSLMTPLRQGGLQGTPRPWSPVTKEPRAVAEPKEPLNGVAGPWMSSHKQSESGAGRGRVCLKSHDPVDCIYHHRRLHSVPAMFYSFPRLVSLCPGDGELSIQCISGSRAWSTAQSLIEQQQQ